MNRRERREEQSAARAQAQALREIVHPPKPPEPAVDVAEMVRAELARERAAEAAEAARAEARRFEGGPCWCCGTTASWWSEKDGTRTPGWSTRRRGQECAGCTQLRGDAIGTIDDDVLDLVAAVLKSEGVSGLNMFNRTLFEGIHPGLAAELGVVGWCDSGAPPGERWQHLAAVAERLERELEAAVRPAGPTLDVLIDAEARPARGAVQRREMVDGRWKTIVVEEGEGDYSFDAEQHAHEAGEVLRKQYARQADRK